MAPSIKADGEETRQPINPQIVCESLRHSLFSRRSTAAAGAVCRLQWSQDAVSQAQSSSLTHSTDGSSQARLGFSVPSKKSSTKALKAGSRQVQVATGNLSNLEKASHREVVSYGFGTTSSSGWFRLAAGFVPPVEVTNGKGPPWSPSPAMCSTLHQIQGEGAMCDVHLPVLRPGPVSRPPEKARQAFPSDSSLSYPASSQTSSEVSSNQFGAAISSSESAAVAASLASSIA